MKELLENYDVLFAMTILTAVAILLKCICAMVYQILLRDSEQAASTKNKWIRSMQTRFEACYKLRIPVHNPSCFIKNHMEQYHFLGFSLKSLENTDILCGLILTGATLLCIMCGMYYDLPIRWVFIHSMTLFFFLLFLAVSELLFQVRHKRKVLHIQLLNYFENTLQGKLENEYLYPEETEAYQNAYFEEDKPEDQTEQDAEPMTAAGEEDKPVGQAFAFEDTYAPAISPDMQELIDSLLEESRLSKELEQKKEDLMTAAAREKFQLVEDIMKEYL